ncbi:MAG: uridine kinase [Cyanobacteria bacterium P01_F01_bin.150]
MSFWLALQSNIPITVEEKRSLRTLHFSPFFVMGLGIRLLLILIAFPKTQQDWFLPFISTPLASKIPALLNPWGTYLSSGGNALSFPYGIIMYLAYLPLTGLGWLVDQGLHINWLAKVGFGLTSLLFDYGVLIGIACLARKYSEGLLLLTYWCSPIVIFILYWHGQLDVLPVLLLVWGLCLLQWNSPVAGGIALGFAISSKFSMLIAIPFILIYLYRNLRLREQLWTLAGTTLITVLLTIVPFLQSPAFVEMVMQSREIQRIYTVHLSYGDDLKLFLLPFIYILSLYLVWRLKRITLDLFIISVGLGFFSLLLLLPPGAGWFLWIMPFLTFYQLRSRGDYLWITFPFFGLYLSYGLLYSTGADIPLLNLNLSDSLAINTVLSTSINRSILFTLLQAFGLLICARMYAFGIRRNNYYRMSRRPLAIGISGDSGSGKDTLVQGIADILGTNAISPVSGDDYHKWERNHPMWSARTHLNPNANNLSRLTQDISVLLDGQFIWKREYDHSTGKFTNPIKIPSRDFVIVSGLHTLYLKRLREQLDLKIFLDIDEDLRIHWKAKRDQIDRGHNQADVAVAIAQRQPDSQQFIHSQSRYADLIFKLAPVNPNYLEAYGRSPRLKLFVQMANGFFHESLVHNLVALCGMHVDVEQSEHLDFIHLCIEGDADKDDISEIARLLIPNLDDLVVRQPNWYEGCSGLMQVIVLAHISDRLHQGRNYRHA